MSAALDTPIAAFDAEAPGSAARRWDEAGTAPRSGLPGVSTLEVVQTLARRYPEPLRSEQLYDAARIASHVDRILRPGASVADLGGGIGLFAPSCAALGMQAWLIDDFGDSVNGCFGLGEIGVHQALGVRVVESPVLSWGESFGDESLAVVTCFGSLEHWHHSPRPVFAEAYRVLEPGGSLLISGSNAVGLRRRLGLPLGRASGSDFEDWYYPDRFRGRVREPVLEDLARLVRELGFEKLAAWGRNWPGHPVRGLRRGPAWLIDRALRPFPTLCSDLYVLARKPT